MPSFPLRYAFGFCLLQLAEGPQRDRVQWTCSEIFDIRHDRGMPTLKHQGNEGPRFQAWHKGSIPCWQVAPSALSASPECYRSHTEHIPKELPDCEFLCETLSSQVQVEARRQRCGKRSASFLKLYVAHPPSCWVAPSTSFCACIASISCRSVMFRQEGFLIVFIRWISQVSAGPYCDPPSVLMRSNMTMHSAGQGALLSFTFSSSNARTLCSAVLKANNFHGSFTHQVAHSQDGRRMSSIRCAQHKPRAASLYSTH